MADYPVKAIANYFLSKYRKHGITPLKLQKLVYLAYGWNFAFNDTPLINDEYAEAWQHGPVFPSLYHEFKHRGRQPILDLAKDTDFGLLKEAAPRVPRSDRDTREFLDRIWEVYGKFSGGHLSELCHEPGTPWDETRRRKKWRRNVTIDDDDIAEYYRELRARNQEHDG